MHKSRIIWVFVGVVNIVLSVLALYATFVQAQYWKIDLLHSKWIALVGLYVFCALSGIFLLFFFKKEYFQSAISFLKLEKLSGRFWQIFGILLFVLVLGTFFPVHIYIFREFLPDIFPNLWILWVFYLIGSIGLKIAIKRSWPMAVALSLISIGIIFQVLVFLPAISDSPFSLNWSEGSQLYYASLLFSKSIYGKVFPLSSLNPAYYFLRSIPFFLSGLPIWFHRAWNVLLSIGITSISAIGFTRRLNISNRLMRWLVAGGFFLFILSAGAIRYELQVCVIIILWGVSTKHPWRSLAVVVAASLWAGMCRLNWFPVPAILACAIYLLDRPVSAVRSLWRYLTWPIIWMVSGIASALTGQAAYIVLSGNGNNLGNFTTSLSSQLLWYRLWPNATYPLGVFLGILIVSFPLVWIIGEALRRHLSEWHPVRLTVLGAMLIILLAGGLVVSIKIGGGSDLHNLDSYRILLALIAMSLYFGCTAREAGSSAAWTPQVKGLWPILSLMISVIFMLNSFLELGENNGILPNNTEYPELQQVVSQASTQKKSILFISQRQLLAFGMVNAPLTPQYESVELAEMAMAGNDEYLNRFYTDIHQHRFDIIIADISTINRRGQDYAFGEESNLWVDSVYSVLFCEYQPEMILENAGIQVMVPRPQPDHCPLINQ